MWQADDSFWLGLTGRKDESPLLTALGVQPLRITASFENENDHPVSRKGYIDIKIVSYDRDSHKLRGNVVENETGLRLSTHTLTLTIIGTMEDETEVTFINEIEGIIF